MEDNEYYKLLVEKYTKGETSKEELELFVQLVKQGKLDPYLLEIMDKDLASLFHEDDSKPLKKRNFRWMISAASICLVLFTGSLFWTLQEGKGGKNLQKIVHIPPDSSKVMLTLGDGRQIKLDNLDTTDLRYINGLSKTADGLLVYKNEGESNLNRTAEITFNTISVPPGGQYQVILPDGSKVLLNASSSLRYPTRFTKSERNVVLIGEGYFEITKNPKRPFYVKTNQQLIKVLGTSFNVYAYDDEDDSKTTLVEGSVEVQNRTHQKMILKPGQQSHIDINDEMAVKNVDMEEELAWKNGNFLFNDTALKNILKMLSRWYAVKVDYTYVPHVMYNGFIARKAPLKEVLNMLEETGEVKFLLKDQTIQVVNQTKRPM